MKQLAETLGTIEHWARESYNISIVSDDLLVPVIARAFDAMSVVLKASGEKQIQRALESLESECSISLRLEKPEDSSARSLMYAVVDCLQKTLFHVNEERKTPTDEVSNQATGASTVLSNENSSIIPVQSQDDPNTFPNLLLKEEPFEISQNIPGEYQKPPLDLMGDEMESVKQEDIAENDMDAGNDDTSHIIKEEDTMDYDMINGNGLDNLMYDDLMERYDENEDVHGAAQPVAVISGNGQNESRVTSVKKNPRSDHEITRAKKRKLSVKEASQSESAKSVRQATKLNDTELECPECEYTSRTVEGWRAHLRKIHFTTPALAGRVLLCDCGKECVTESHKLTCNIANFTIIRKRDGPIRRLDDEKLTPRCTECEMYPKTPSGYVQHLQAHHKTTLMASGIYLKCPCAWKITNFKSLLNHDKKCDGREFTLHKLDEE